MKIAELKEWLGRAGVRPSRVRGQNFLVDENLLDAIVRDAGVEGTDVVLEVGVGLGVLTERLARVAHKVVAVETEPRLAAVFRQRCPGEAAGVRIVEADVLAGKQRINPLVWEALEEEVPPGGRVVVVSNLPYSVATPVVVGLLGSPVWGGWGARLGALHVMVQWEVAERFVARSLEAPGYGAVSVLCEALCGEAQIVREVSRTVFHPRPKVTSAIVRLEPREDRLEGFAELQWVVRALFDFRRKTVRQAAKHAAKRHAGGEWVREAVERGVVDGGCRVEALGLEGFRKLAEETPQEFRRLGV